MKGSVETITRTSWFETGVLKKNPKGIKMSKLTEEMVIARSRQSDLSSIKKLNCWYVYLYLIWILFCYCFLDNFVIVAFSKYNIDDGMWMYWYVHQWFWEEDSFICPKFNKNIHQKSIFTTIYRCNCFVRLPSALLVCLLAMWFFNLILTEKYSKECTSSFKEQSIIICRK